MQPDGQEGALLNALLSTAADAIIVSDSDGIIQRANEAACHLFQYSTEEMLGQSVNILMPQALADLHDGFMQQYAETGEKRVLGIGRDVEGQRKDKSVFPLHLLLGETNAGDQHMFVAILRDLTHNHATQNALARSQRLDAIGQMTGGIAHDFNNLLTVVIGNLELMEMRGVTSGQLSLIRDALDSAELGADLTARLMVFARKSNLRPVEVDLKDVCEKTLSILRRALGSTYTIRTDFAADISKVMIDPVQLQSALMNLTLNARDAMGPTGELLISIANITIDDTYMAQETDITPGDYVRLFVSDNGAGMSIEAQRRAFEPFFTTKSESGGTGLGLAMVYGFVRQSGGHITLYSELDLGTSFGLYFPAISGTQGKAGGSGREHTEDTVPPGKGQTVLVVEDNPKVRKLSVQRIRDLGFKTAEASSGDEAYQMLRDGLHADVVFSDLVMPGSLNGYDLAAKATADFPHLKVLLTSGYASDVVTGKMSRGQDHDILHKPYRQWDLATRLQALLTDGSGV
ncbi:PAS domain S-box protein [Roseobacter sp. YSTF-M11]|uniref:Sensor protein FixL n=1 Tax=Roseobacter insulae TaxID=2859783 RepID=A0A9X1FRH1_9RHOB|nr:PAS domain S-box protein [Roseobacter insulae]MBW4706292.1 PAS domain S-box protein [Roseobacter insulae]